VAATPPQPHSAYKPGPLLLRGPVAVVRCCLPDDGGYDAAPPTAVETSAVDQRPAAIAYPASPGPRSRQVPSGPAPRPGLPRPHRRATGHGAGPRWGALDHAVLLRYVPG